MIWLTPDRVLLGTAELASVSSIVIDREAARLNEEWSDLGPHQVFCDVPEQRATVVITRRLNSSDASSPAPGEAHALTFRAAPGQSAVGVRLFSIQVVIVSVTHTLTSEGKAQQRLRALAISPDGVANPIVESDIQGEL